ncbi:hypothetical protein BLNAU_25047 [Blattamonas nauphoetae]|uniref:Uncharacterized protein n=1 Tax=Blattamonas nauphoetae TaxID=2049346 RepID=A0ABQ9WKN0_9EUKA|nr:hypothetical protein BLNAU_25047 [Blattamonas nauphoetae]
MKKIHRNIALCLSNVSGITELHSLRILSETIPGPHSPQKLLQFVSDRLVDDTSTSFCADLSIVHGLFLHRSAPIYAEIEKSQVLAAIFTFKWYRRTHRSADTCLCIFFEILISFILNASAPYVIFEYVQNDVIEQELLKSTKEFSVKQRKQWSDSTSISQFSNDPSDKPKRLDVLVSTIQTISI